MQFDFCVWFNNTDEFSQAHAMAAVFSVIAPPDNKNTAHWTYNKLIIDWFTVCVFMCVYVVCTACGCLEE